MKDGKKGIFLRWAALAFISIAVLLLWIGLYAVSSGPLQNKDGVVIFIPPETGFAGIHDILITSDVIEPDLRFTILARLTGVSKSLKAGEYKFSAGQTPYQVLRALESGTILQSSFTITEGANIYQVADIISKNGYGDRARFLELVQDPDFINELGLQVESLEGYLFPDTYHFARGQNEKNIITMMVDRFKEVFDQIEKQDSAVAQSFSSHEILTLASIVEKETAVPEERPLIARVFLNRLRKGMRLQADPTVIYGLSKFDGNLTRRDLKASTPYNTYVIKGLPPGPIGNPGRASIEAVLYPAKESYLYFVSKNDGTHHFSKSLRQHNRAVIRYQKKRSSR